MQTKRTVVHMLNDKGVGSTFDQTEYSKFKYGMYSISKKFGGELFEKFLEENEEFLKSIEGTQIAITASPYKYLAPSASSIAKHFTDCLNKWLYENGKSSSNIIKITRDVLFEGDYGLLKEEERLELLSKDRLGIDKEFVKDKYIIFIDDILVTGSHERKIQKMLTDENVVCKGTFYLYYAMIEEYTNADIEAIVNHAHVDSLEKLLEISKSPCFELNARNIKFVLSQKDTNRLQRFLFSIGISYVEDIYYSSIGDGYQYMEMYKPNFKIVEDFLKSFETLNMDRILKFSRNIKSKENLNEEVKS